MHLDALGYLDQPTVDQVPDLAPTLCASMRKRIVFFDGREKELLIEEQ